MSYYYKYQFVSPSPIYAIVKEELKSYIDTNAIDDLLFSTWLDKCMRKLGKSSYSIKETLLTLEDFKARLPDSFYAVREAWLCTSTGSTTYQLGGGYYTKETSTEVSGINQSRRDCEITCFPDTIEAVYKTTTEATTQRFSKNYLLSPGNISVKDHCTLDCANFGSSADDSFDIRDNKFVTNFREGSVYLVYYSQDEDINGNQLIPDNYRIQEYVEAFLKYKCFELLSNQITDETFNQIQQKMLFYKQESDQAYIMAEIELKKQDSYAKIRAIKKQLNSFQKYNISSGGFNRWRK